MTASHWIHEILIEFSNPVAFWLPTMIPRLAAETAAAGGIAREAQEVRSFSEGPGVEEESGFQKIETWDFKRFKPLTSEYIFNLLCLTFLSGFSEP